MLAKTRIGELTVQDNPCPVCNNLIEGDETLVNFGVSERTSLEEELSSLQRRRLSIQKLIQDLLEKINELQRDRAEFLADLDKARQLLDTETQEMVTPYLTQRDSVVRALSMKEQERISIAHDLKIRNQQELIHKKYESVGKSLAEILDKITVLKENAPSVSDVLSDLGDYFNKYLENVKIKNRTDIGISEKHSFPLFVGGIISISRLVV